MKVKIFSLLMALSLGFIYNAQAQRVFSEGVLTYDVYINGSKKPNGTYLVTIKERSIKRELKLFNGRNATTIYSGGQMLDMRTINGQGYALKLSESEVAKRNARFADAQYNFTARSKTFAGFDCEQAKVVYANGSEASFYYTKDLVPSSDNVLSMFPSLKGLPLEYEVKGGSSKMKFVGRLVEFKNVDSDTFNIPSNYKVVSKEELKRFQ